MCLRFLKRQLSRNEARSPTKIEPDNVVTHLIAPFPRPAAGSKRVGLCFKQRTVPVGDGPGAGPGLLLLEVHELAGSRRKPSQIFIISSLTASAVFRQKAAERRAGSTPVTAH
jgi:hypothetical protein